ncbi:MAG: FAD-dependent oxidoreductase [Tannerella sp.]|jgi:ribulose 1,5-bisphosphate synthetase/thiazole synthase|nr:FAD-dependent oxidoreductase [Tannerella sp.]
MKKQLFSAIAVIMMFCSCGQENEVKEVDICIYGGTSAGVIASYTAKMEGKTVLLIEPDKHLGGMSSGGLGYTDIGNKYVVTGLSRDFYRRIGKHYGKLEQWIFEPHVAEKVFNDFIETAGVEVRYGKKLSKVEKNGDVITEITVDNQKIKAKIFIDCTYEGDLMAKAGVSYTVGREANSVYNETYNGFQMMDGHQFGVDIDPYVEKGNPESGLLWGIGVNQPEPSGTGDRKVQAYNFRICLTDSAENRLPIEKPDNYDPQQYELLVRLNEVSPFQSLNDIFIWSRMPNRKTDINNRGAFSTDMIGMNWDYPEADYAARKQIWQAHTDYTKGLLYFVGNDPHMPEPVRTEMKKWGYPKDEYADNAHWTHQLYIREARRMVGELVMTQHHCEGREVCTDAVGWAAYTMDSHNCDRLVVNGLVRNEGNVEIGGFPPYPISYRAITPQKQEVTNLLVPVCLSASHIAYGSIRMEPVFMVLAQSAATAACMAIDAKTTVQDIDVQELQNYLKNNPLANNSTPEILIDNDDTQAVTLDGEWQTLKDTHSSYGAAADFLTDNSKGNPGKSVKYTPDIQKEGFYEIYVYYPLQSNGSTLTSINIYNGKETIVKTIDQKDVIVQGQTAGEWVYLGEYGLPEGKNGYVEITNRNADGAVTADAVLFIPRK